MIYQVSDVDGDALTFSASNGSVDGTTLTITPPADYNGSEDITVVVTDGDLSDSTTFTLTVNPVNDAPVVANPIDDIIADEDSDAISIDLSTVFDDVENGSNLSFSFSENVAAVEASLDGSVLTLNFLENENGSGSVTVSASDVVSRLSVQDSFDVTVTPVNDAPVADATSAAGDEDSNISIDLSGSDIDGDALTFSLGSGASNGSVDVSGSTATYTPNSDFNGSDSFTFVASDGELSSEATVDVTVNPVNDAPTFITSSLDSIDEDVAYQFILDVNDIDNSADELNVSISSGPSWLSISGLNLSGTPSGSDVGTSSVLLNLTDGDIITSSSFELTVNAVNDPPVAEDQSVTLNEDDLATIYVYGDDEDSEGLTFTITSNPEHGSLDSQREFATYVYSPDNNYNGSDSFSFTVSDGEFSSEGTVSLEIVAVNDAPTATNEYIELNENTSAPVYYLTEDVDGDDLKYSCCICTKLW